MSLLTERLNDWEEKGSSPEPGTTGNASPSLAVNFSVFGGEPFRHDRDM
jgi:hypothetical protein